mmetsp:Transcript_16526/g.32610  ORF Transcript_16526/g.32610 Transcript_16526/m.32610 type:complete len:538 (+) Transcript_16526:83-1696(+)|eukprot:CAMPEP_0173416406 /NCGR_PEP_ID=MMETSP1356-20130122/85373_1 /TAXON_ID=77927 ORGANISM="Hemiselmis virescens, Strain PCC157" /NCGR_SAMPLE_ID=MMETSP1356 /ASSEMBLY_ACC=CAM_ASM_000847 /LENGTH=537 /DNA_ID=CAMNT_0014378713 /DNA_START=52 /DNA_END=1665 /DNA_ORIENTATION=+
MISSSATTGERRGSGAGARTAPPFRRTSSQNIAASQDFRRIWNQCHSAFYLACHDRLLQGVTAFYLVCVVAWCAAEVLEQGRVLARICMCGLLVLTFRSYAYWRTTFAHRPGRGESSSASNRRRPGLSSSAAAGPDKMHPKDDAGLASRRRRGSAEGHVQGKKHLSERRASCINMDHHHLSLVEYMWGQIFITAPLYFGVLLGSSRSYGMLRMALWSCIPDGLRSRLRGPRPDQARLFAEILLETTASIYTLDDLHEADDGLAEASFVIPDVSCVGESGQLVTGTLQGRIDLTYKRLIHAEYCGKRLDPSDAVLLLWIAQSYVIHPRVHAFANWAVNTSSSNPLLRRLSVTTILFNHFGWEAFARLLDTLRGWGGLNRVDGWHHESMRNLGERANYSLSLPPGHRHIRKLAKYSKYVNYIIKAREVFLQEFCRCKADFPGVDGEAFFVGAVIHSTDHHQGLKVIDTLDFKCTDPFFSLNVQICHLIHGCFNEEVSLASLMHCNKFNNVAHPLFAKTYARCKEIDRELADAMDCCVIR